MDPAALVRRHVRRRGPRVLLGGQDVGAAPVTLVAVGKAASTMAAAAAARLGPSLRDALVVDSSDHVPLPAHLPRLLAGHPTPDARGVRAARAVEALLGRLGAGDVVLLLLSGGASALLPAPVRGVSLRDKARTARLLMDAGASIGELNTVRRHLSRLKGGGLARQAAPARVVTLALSDVVGDDPATLGSGPAAPDPSTFEDAWAVLTRHHLLSHLPAGVKAHLRKGRRGEVPENPGRRDPVFRRVHHVTLGGTRATAEAALREARRHGCRAVPLGHAFAGEARGVGRAVATALLHAATGTRRPVCLVGSGETTVTVRGRGRGGRNQEMAVAAVEPLARMPVPAVAAFFGTDGIDGPTPAAGGVADDTSRARARALGLPSPARVLAANDNHRYLAALGDLIVTGPTGTNAADVFVLIAAGAG